MRSTHTIIIGGGQAGLAMSRCLSDRSIEHVVLERGRIAERWRSERWDSLRLLTPNWMSRLPGYRYQGTRPTDYMSMPEVIDYFERYSQLSRVPIETETAVNGVEALDEGFRVDTDRGSWSARNVVVATGYSDLPAIPPMSRELSPEILQIDPTRYRNVDRLPSGGVLVVGAAASGIQLADEIAASGRAVTLAVGRHNRMPRTYRGRDILWWLQRMGVLDQTTDHVYNLDVSKQQPAFQLVGRPDRSSIDLGRLARRGVRIVGRAAGADGVRMTFDDDLIATTIAADVKLVSLLQRVDRFVEESGLAEAIAPPEPFEPTWPMFFDQPAPAELDLRAEGIETVLWATGFRRSYPWLKVPILDERGEIRQHRGVTAQPGLYVLGLQFQHTRKSAFIDGVGLDAAELARHIAVREQLTAAVA